MIKEFISKWDSNKDKLKEYFKTTPQREYNEYEKIVKLICEIILEKEYSCCSWKYQNRNIITIDHGDYQGTQLFIIPRSNCYQPDPKDYIWTYVYYGSCPGCDTLLNISCYDDGIPNDVQVKDYMTLALHLFQRLQRFDIEKEYFY